MGSSSAAGGGKMPVAFDHSLRPFVRHVRDLIDASLKTQRQIALEIGYSKPNLITMFKQGTTRIPADKVADLALVLETDPVDLLRRWYTEYEPHMLQILDRHFGHLLSAAERALIDDVRQRFPEGLPSWVCVRRPAP